MRIGRFGHRLLATGVGLTLAGGLVVAAAPAGATPTPDVAVDPTSRASVLQAYQSVYAPALQVPSGWTGSVASCTPGADSAAAQSATLRAVNFARALVGRPRVTMDPTLSAQALTGALIMDASGSLNHDPAPGQPCYTDAGHTAAAHSNLYLAGGTTSAAAAVDAYLTDDGSGNAVAGHRRWLLYSGQTKIGSGTTARANALWVIDPASWTAPASFRQVAAWPSAGYFPASMEPDGRWSLSVPGADFSNATVVVKKGTKVVPTTVTSRTDNGYGDNTIVWSLDPHYDISQGDQTYSVSVRGWTVNGATHSTSYTTTLFDATVGMKKRNVISFPWPTSKKVGTTFDPGATDNNGLTVYYFSNTPSVCTASQNPNRVTIVGVGTCSIGAFVPSDPRYPDAEVQTRTFPTRA